MALKRISFGTTRIQKLRRIALDQNLLETLGLEIGDSVKIELDTESGAVLISPAPQQPSKQQKEVATTMRNARAKRK